MNKTLLGFLVWCSASLSLAATPPDRAQLETQLHDRTGYFEPNTGHLEHGVDFVGRTAAMEAALRPDRAVFALSGNRERLQLRFSGSRNAPAAGLDRQTAVTYYLMDQQKPTAAAPRYGRVQYKEIYPGIDIVSYFQGQNIEYDFVVKPGAEPRVIRLIYEGSLKTNITGAGELAIETSSGEFKQLPPRVYQQQGNGRTEVPARYRQHRDGLGFELDRYDASRELIIDPVIVYSSLYGSAGDESIFKIAVDSSAAVYVTGTTTNPSSFLVTPGQIGINNQPIVQNTLVTAQGLFPFVAKFAPNSGGGPLQLVWAAIIGYAGSGAWGEQLAVDGFGGVYVGGRVGTYNLYGADCQQPWRFYVQKLKQTVYNGQPFLEVSGAACPLGGTLDDTHISRMVAWPGGGLYLAGTTLNPNYPVLNGLPGVGAPARGQTESHSKGFVMRLDWSGSSITTIWSTLFGGFDSTKWTGIRGMAVGPFGDVFIAGSTSEVSIPLVQPMMSQLPAHGRAAFLARIAQPKLVNGQLQPIAVKYSTLFTAAAWNTHATAVAVDAAGKAYVAGEVSKNDSDPASVCGFPTKGGVQLDCNGDSDAFLALFPEPAPGQAMDTEAATVFGGDRTESVYDVRLDNRGGVYLIGGTTSNEFAWKNGLSIPPPPYGRSFLTRFQSPGGVFGLLTDYSTWLPVVGQTPSIATYGGSVFIAGQPYDPSQIDQSVGTRGGFDGLIMQIRDQMTITVTSQPANRQIELMGAGCGHQGYRKTPFTAVVTPGGGCRFTAADDNTADSKYEFARWWDNNFERQRYVVFGDAPATYTAHFNARYRLLSSVSPSKAGTISPSGETWHLAGSSVAHTVDANACYLQTGWSPGVANGVAIMDAPKQAIAQMTWWGASEASNFTVSVVQTVPDAKATKVVVRIRNNSAAARQAIAIALDNLTRGVVLQKATGVTRCALPAGSPYLDIGNFSGYETREVTLLFTVPDGATKTVGFAPRMLQGLKPR